MSLDLSEVTRVPPTRASGAATEEPHVLGSERGLGTTFCLSTSPFQHSLWGQDVNWNPDAATLTGIEPLGQLLFVCASVSPSVKWG